MTEHNYGRYNFSTRRREGGNIDHPEDRLYEIGSTPATAAINEKHRLPTPEDRAAHRAFIRSAQLGKHGC